jgi:hypothetical protein
MSHACEGDVVGPKIENEALSLNFGEMWSKACK